MSDDTPAKPSPDATETPPDSPFSDKPESVRISTPSCVICGKPVVARYRPFCSTRCADLDLGRWLTESYRLPTNESPEDDGLPPPDEGF